MTPDFHTLATDLADKLGYLAPARIGTTLGNGLVLRLIVDPDEHASILDEEDWCGKLEPISGSNWFDYPPTRPNGFDGRARKLRVGPSGDGWWWQPPADLADEHLTETARSITDLMEGGYYVITAEWLLASSDTAEIDLGGASIGGVECSADGEYLQTLIESQIEEAWETIDFEAKIADLRALTDTLVKL